MTITATSIDPKVFHLLQLKHALALEAKGMKLRQGSVYAHVKRKFGFKGNKQRVYDQLVDYIDANYPTKRSSMYDQKAAD